ncbi:MAG TPA: pilus assembly protein N-terminal domain-containing protein, partial [Gemmataceae bacterium]|nr:pilus assembly protein N-terminal domain-containing protein [Gemmataceae bacterium]
MTCRAASHTHRRAGLPAAAIGAALAAVLSLVGPASAQEPDKLPPAKDVPKVLPPMTPADLPAPAGVPGFGPGRDRLSRMGDKGALGSTPKPTPEDLKEFGQFIDGVIDPRNTLDVIEGRTRLILLKQTPTQTQIGDDGIAAFNLLGQKQITLLGKKVGTTVLTLWFPDPVDKTKEKILSYLVRVLPDPTIKERLEKVYEALERELAEVFPDAHIKLSLVGDKLVVRGQAKDVAEATQILRILRANAPGNQNQQQQQQQGAPAPGVVGAPGMGVVPDATKVPITNVNVNLPAGDPTNPTGTPGLESYQLSGGPNVINLLRIPGEQQVMLRVTVAEVNRAAARSIGLNFSFLNNSGIPVFSQTTGNLNG